MGNGEGALWGGLYFSGNPTRSFHCFHLNALPWLSVLRVEFNRAETTINV